MIGKITIVIAIAALTMIAMVSTVPFAEAYKLTKTSYQDGYAAGFRDARLGIGYSVSSEHTDVYISGYQNGYRDGLGHTEVTTQSQAQAQTQSQGVDIHVQQSQAQSQSQR
ncbi:MAG: hypothetical protein WBP64_12210 [Nitrososphaeraceae archaeon]